MKRKLLILLTVSIGLPALMLPSCEKYILPAISLAQDTVFVEQGGSKVSQLVTSNVDWQPSSSEEWIDIETVSGAGTDSLVFTVFENVGNTDRTGKVFVESETIRKILYVIQSGTVE